VLRSTPDKFGGLLLMFATIIDSFILDMLGSDDLSEELEDNDIET